MSPTNHTGGTHFEALVVPVEGPYYRIELGRNTDRGLRALQEAVGGTIQAVPLPDFINGAAQATAYVNDEGKYTCVDENGKPLINKRATDFMAPGRPVLRRFHRRADGPHWLQPANRQHGRAAEAGHGPCAAHRSRIRMAGETLAALTLEQLDERLVTKRKEALSAWPYTPGQAVRGVEAEYERRGESCPSTAPPRTKCPARAGHLPLHGGTDESHQPGGHHAPLLRPQPSHPPQRESRVGRTAGRTRRPRPGRQGHGGEDDTAIEQLARWLGDGALETARNRLRKGPLPQATDVTELWRDGTGADRCQHEPQPRRLPTSPPG